MHRIFNQNSAQRLGILLVIVFCIISPSVQAISSSRMNSLINNRPFHDPTDTGTCETISASAVQDQASSSVAGPVYLVGDSIGVGVAGPLATEFTQSGDSAWSLVSNSVSGRSLKQGIAEIEKAPAELKSAKTVLVILGTNNVNETTNSVDVTNMVSKIKSANSTASIYWLKMNVTKTELVAGAGAFNGIIGATAGITPLESTVDLEPDGYHPTAVGYAALGKSIATIITKGGASQEPAKGCVCPTSTATNLSGADNAEKIWNYFTGKGLTAIQTAGIMGNMQQESGLDPENIQDPAGRSQNPDDAGGAGWGLIQWTPGSKIKGIAEQANVKTKIYELGTQLEIVWWHMNNISPTGAKNMIVEFKNTQTIEEAVSVFEHRVEGAGTPALSNRIKYANNFLKQFGGGSAPTPATPVSVTASSCAGITGSGENTQYIDGFTVYSQTDPAWKDLPYDSSTIGESGCGPAAMAMIITALTGKSVTPVETANVAASMGLYDPGVGSSWDIGPKLASHWKLKSQNVGANITNITVALQAGGLVIASGTGAKPFTEGGHFLVIRGVTDTGKFKVGDSGHSDTSDKEWDPQQLIESMKGKDGSVYAITK